MASPSPAHADGGGEGDMAARLDAMQPEQCADEAARYAAKEAARRLLARLETPYEQAFTLAVATPMLMAALETCRELGVWARWAAAAAADAGAPKTLADVLAMCCVPAEENLLRRLLRHIATYRVLRETGEDEWAPTAFSRALGDAAGHIDLMLKAGADQIWPPALNLPGFLRRHGYAEPRADTKGPDAGDGGGGGGGEGTADNWTELYGCDYFDSVRRDPSRGADFEALMTATRNYKTDWTAVYDTSRLFGKAAEKDAGWEEAAAAAETVTGAGGAHVAPLFVDVGACHGLDAARLRARHPDLPAGALVIEDLPGVLERTAAAAADGGGGDDGIRRVAHDFFAPQPVAGARAYFFHAVLHDWPDAACRRILARAAAAMTRPGGTEGAGGSRLLVYDVVIPAVAAAPFQTGVDLALMATLSGLERTEHQWRRLLAAAGLRVLAIHRLPRAVESVIEAELA